MLPRRFPVSQYARTAASARRANSCATMRASPRAGKCHPFGVKSGPLLSERAAPACNRAAGDPRPPRAARGRVGLLRPGGLRAAGGRPLDPGVLRLGRGGAEGLRRAGRGRAAAHRHAAVPDRGPLRQRAAGVHLPGGLPRHARVHRNAGRVGPDRSPRRAGGHRCGRGAQGSDGVAWRHSDRTPGIAAGPRKNEWRRPTGGT